ncbi:BRI1 kinase inhibitor 1 [Carica papaya]|uniref:BRI1 kinase inhibitor 1 n=1 Tax=Carica papaya TaxID=3649 RepID=UPI000B8D0453|nr:BRI1 kinase inhibitor 1 [Carica papaya]
MDTHEKRRDKQREEGDEEAKLPSASSSPSHEFSFTISLHPSADKTKLSLQPSQFAIDLSPADDIFFHGHLLPLHLLAHLPLSPRSSTNSTDSFTLPIIKDDTQRPNNTNLESTNSVDKTNKLPETTLEESTSKPRSNFSFLFRLTRWRKGLEGKQEEEKEKQGKKKKLRLELSDVIKRYVRMVRPLLFFKRREKVQLRRQQAYSFSGNLSNSRNKAELRGRRGEYNSAPASMRTSPSNSGLLLATTSITSSSSSSDSTMEELQAAIQAAIAHCKNSIAVEDKLK